MPNIIVVEHAGWPERKAATLIPGLHEVPSRGEVVTVVTLENGELHAVPSEFVFTTEGLRYAEEWATKTHSGFRGVVLPAALRVENM